MSVRTTSVSADLLAARAASERAAPHPFGLRGKVARNRARHVAKTSANMRSSGLASFPYRAAQALATISSLAVVLLGDARGLTRTAKFDRS